MSRINVFDQDTLEHLRAQGVGDETLRRVRIAMEENADNAERAQRMDDEITRLRELLADREPTVVWQIPLSYARTLIDFLHRNMPGGYQAHHDDLRAAIERASDD